MIKKFIISLPMPLGDAFALVRKSGDEVPSWQTKNVDAANHYFEWKQNFWALTGTTLISARLEKTEELLTTVTVEVHKPLQMIDPFGICKMIFRKLENSCRTNYEHWEREQRK